MKGYKPKYLRQKNYDNILNLFKFSRALSASDIHQHVELSRTTINNIINKLADVGVLKSIGKGQSTNEGGKRPMLYELNEDYAYEISIMALNDGCAVRVFNMGLATLYHKRYKYDERISYEALLDITAQIIESVIKELQIPIDRLYGIAYHCGGIVDSVNRVVIRPMANALPDNCHFAEDLDARLHYHVPILVENSARCAANFELLRSQNQMDATLFVINISIGTNETLAVGVGGCLIINGQIDPASNGYLSEIGHMIVDVDSKVRCKCGNYGCLETFFEDRNITAMVERLLERYPERKEFYENHPKPIALHIILKYARNGDELAGEVCDKIVGAFAAMLHNMQLECDPERIIIQGEEDEELMEFFISKIRERVSRQSFFEMEGNVQMEYSHGEFEMQSNLGAASFCRDKYLKNMMLDISMQEA